VKDAPLPRLGVLGGTFDPPHYGHLAAAEEAGEQLGLGRVLFLPTGEPPHKQGEPITPVAHRVRMTELAIDDNPRFALSRVDVDRPGASYTVDTLALLQAAHGPTELYFICGMDMLASFLDWYEPARVLAQCQLVVVTRPTYPLVDLDALERALPGARARIHLLRVPGVDVSSTELSERAAAGRSLRYLTPPAVIDYIHAQELYRGKEITAPDPSVAIARPPASDTA
jgi:nicotinate-nucleotide adenylyltransferase